MFAAIKTRLHAKHSERIFLDAQRGLIERRRLTPRRIIGYVLALSILALPVGFFALGVWMIVFQSEHMFMIIGGIFALIFAYVIHPRPLDRDIKEFDRSDMPELFRLIHAISNAIGVTPPSAVGTSYHFSDFVVTTGVLRRRAVVGMSLPLWWIRDDAERIAGLAQ